MQVVKEDQFTLAVQAIDHCRELLIENAKQFNEPIMFCFFQSISGLNFVEHITTTFKCSVQFQNVKSEFISEGNSPELAIADITDQMARYFNPENFGNV